MKKYIILAIIVVIVLLFAGSPLRRVYAPLKYRKLIKQCAAKYELDWLLVSSLIYYESRFRSDAQSSKGARGLMQIMPETGVETAKKLGWSDFTIDQLFDPETNIELGCYYLKDLLGYFDNDIELALAAYNAGRGSIYKWHDMYLVSEGTSRSNGIEYVCIEEYVYPETRRYVSNVNGTYKLLRFMNSVCRL